MAFFKPRLRWTETNRIKPRTGPLRAILALLFFVWGLGGMALMFAGVAEMGNITSHITVRIPPDLATQALLWIGGMVFFGLGALIISSPSYVSQRDDFSEIEN